jgi:hypothetical protein
MAALFQNEQFGFYLLAAGAVLAVVGSVWLLIRAFQTTFGWGLAVLFLPVIGPILFLIQHGKKAKAPIALILLGAVLSVLPVALNAAFGEKRAAKPLIRETGGMKEFTATAALDPDYAALSANPDLEIVNIARADFTDETAERLRGLTKLRRLELNDSAITDKGLAIIATLPTLETLAVARVKGITDEGVKDTVLKIATLKEIDARGTAVKVETLRTWRSAGPDRKTNPK